MACNAQKCGGTDAGPAVAGTDDTKAQAYRDLLDYWWPKSQPFPPVFPWVASMATRWQVENVIWERRHQLPAMQANGTSPDGQFEALQTLLGALGLWEEDLGRPDLPLWSINRPGCTGIGERAGFLYENDSDDSTLHGSTDCDTSGNHPVGPHSLRDLRCMLATPIKKGDENWQKCDAYCATRYPNDKPCAAGCFSSWDEQRQVCTLSANCTSCDEVPGAVDEEPIPDRGASR